MAVPKFPTRKEEELIQLANSYLQELIANVVIKSDPLVTEFFEVEASVTG